MATLLVPNFLNSTAAFDVQADARDGRFTWKLINGKLVPGVVVKAKPMLRFPVPVEMLSDEVHSWPSSPAPADYAATLAAIDAAASTDDVLAWAFAARWWVNFAWQAFNDAACVTQVSDEVDDTIHCAGARGVDVYKQFSEWGWPFMGPGAPQLAPNVKNPITGSPLGGYQYIAGGDILLAKDSWPKYFATLVAQIVAKSVQRRVGTLIEIQIVMRGVAFFMAQMSTPDDPEVVRKVWSA